MEEVTLTETETRYYSDLFLFCDVDKTGKIPRPKAMELLHSANLTDECIIEITSLAGIPQTALHISRVQFYSCLKLIAAHQAALPLRQELIVATVQLELPRLGLKDSDLRLSPLLVPSPNDCRNSLHKRPEDSIRNTRYHQRIQENLKTELTSTDSEIEQNDELICADSMGLCIRANESCAASNSSCELHERRDGGGSPEAWSTNSDSPTPTNSVTERPWANDKLWHGLLGDEHRQLLGTEEESSDRHSSEDDDNENELMAIYQITPEQQEYYYKQFQTVQRDPKGLLSGQSARLFFEKSRIPVEELRHIWQLCDVTRDGALSLSEFTAAMHLVVLRRNNIPLPTTLPACLHPNILSNSISAQQLEPPEADLLHLNDEDIDKTDVAITKGNINFISTLQSEKNVISVGTISTSSQASINAQDITPPKINSSITNSPSNEKISTRPGSSSSATNSVPSKEIPQKLWAADGPSTKWTKFSESPTNLSSPGLKPVNFDIKRTAQEVGNNPQILHPVPLRVTPVANAVVTVISSLDTTQQQQTSGDDNTMQRGPSPKSSASQQTQQHHRDSLQNNDLRAIQRPQAKKLSGKSIGALPPPPQRESNVGSSDATVAVNDVPVNQLYTLKKEPPPLPPPRPHRHTRSSSLDLNKFKVNASNSQQPEINMQASFDLQTSTGFADFTNFSEDNSAATHISVSTAKQKPQIEKMLPSQFSEVSSQKAMQSTNMFLQSNQRVSAFEVYRKPNIIRNCQSPPVQSLQHLSKQHKKQLQPPVSSATCDFPATGISSSNLEFSSDITKPIPSADIFERRVAAISETLRHVTFKRNEQNMPEVLRRLREQNTLLLLLCNDLSDELLRVQTRKEEIKLKIHRITSSSSSSTNSANAVISKVSLPSQPNTLSSASGNALPTSAGVADATTMHTNI